MPCMQGLSSCVFTQSFSISKAAVFDTINMPTQKQNSTRKMHDMAGIDEQAAARTSVRRI